jgi:hypothetical protein
MRLKCRIHGEMRIGYNTLVGKQHRRHGWNYRRGLEINIKTDHTKRKTRCEVVAQIADVLNSGFCRFLQKVNNCQLFKEDCIMDFVIIMMAPN